MCIIVHFSRTASKAKMPLCKAIHEETYHSCEYEARKGHRTCEAHKNFFKHWVVRFFDPTYRLDNPDLEALEGSRIHRLTSHMEQILKSRCVKVTRDDLTNINDYRRGADGYLILYKDPTVDPYWHKSLVLDCIYAYFEFFTRTEDIIHKHLPPPTMERAKKIYKIHFAPLAENPNVDLVRLLTGMQTSRHILDIGDHPQSVRDMYTLGYVRAFDVFFEARSDYYGTYSLYSDEVLYKVLLNNNWRGERITKYTQHRDEFFLSYILPKIKAMKKEFQETRKAEMAALKEELVARVFHPRRIEQWLNLGEEEGECMKYIDMMF